MSPTHTFSPLPGASLLKGCKDPKLPSSHSKTFTPGVFGVRRLARSSYFTDVNSPLGFPLFPSSPNSDSPNAYLPIFSLLPKIAAFPKRAWTGALLCALCGGSVQQAPSEGLLRAGFAGLPGPERPAVPERPIQEAEPLEGKRMRGAVCARFPPPRLHGGLSGREPDLCFALSPPQPRRLSSERRRPAHTCCPARNGAERSQAPAEEREARRSRGRPGFPALTPPRGPPSLPAPPGAERAGPGVPCEAGRHRPPARPRPPAPPPRPPEPPSREAGPGGDPAPAPRGAAPARPSPALAAWQPRRQAPGRPGGGASLPAPGPARCRAAARRLRRGRSGEAGVRLAAPVRGSGPRPAPASPASLRAGARRPVPAAAAAAAPPGPDSAEPRSRAGAPAGTAGGAAPTPRRDHGGEDPRRGRAGPGAERPRAFRPPRPPPPPPPGAAAPRPLVAAAGPAGLVRPR